MKIALLSDAELERIVTEELARAERNGLAVNARDCELTLARMVAVRLRKIDQQHEASV